MENVPFLKQIVTGEKRKLCTTGMKIVKGNELPTEQKASLQPKKMRLCIRRTGRESSIMRFWKTNN